MSFVVAPLDLMQGAVPDLVDIHASLPEATTTASLNVPTGFAPGHAAAISSTA
jgi:hypothetical protein